METKVKHPRLLCCHMIINSRLHSGLGVTELINKVPHSGERVIIRNGNLGGGWHNSERVMAIISKMSLVGGEYFNLVGNQHRKGSFG